MNSAPSAARIGRQRRGLGRATGRAVFVREVEAEFVLVVLDRLQRGQFDIGVAGKAARVDHPGVIAGLAMHDLLRQQPAMAAAFAQTGAQADDAKGVALAGDRADQRRAVDGVGDRAVDDAL